MLGRMPSILSEPAPRWVTAPWMLRLATLLFFAWGGIAAGAMLWQLVARRRVHLDLDVFQLWVGWWLWKLDPRGRRIGLIFLRIGIGLILVAVAAVWLAPGLVELSPFGDLLGPISLHDVALTLGGELLVNLWLYYVLQRQDVRALFESRALNE
jgi:hypothetical protein